MASWRLTCPDLAHPHRRLWNLLRLCNTGVLFLQTGFFLGYRRRSAGGAGRKERGSMVNNKITNVPQPARSILRGYPDIEGVASLHAQYLEAVSSGDDGAIREAQQRIETLLDGKNQIFEQRNRPERVRYEPENNRVVVKRGGTTLYTYDFSL